MDRYNGCTEFFVFNSTLSKREDDEDNKILFFYPPTEHQGNKHKEIGLCEAVIHFAEPFTDKPLESIHTEKRAFFLYNPEPDTWFVMVMSNPRGDISLDPNAALMSGQTSGGSSSSNNNNNTTADGSTPTTTSTPTPTSSSSTTTSGVTSPSPSSPAPSGDNSGSGSNGEGCSGPYIENYWDDNCMLAALSGIYAQYRFFNGTVAADLEEGDAGRQRAQKRLEGFLPKFILNTGWRNANLFTALGGIHFLPVDKHVYLQLHRLVSEAEDRYRDSVLATSVLYGDHLVWSGLEQQDVRVLYKMLTSHLCTRSSEYPFFFSDVYENLRNPGCSVITPGIRIFLGPNVPTSEDKKEKAKAEVRPATLVIYRHQQLLFAFVLRQGCEAAPEGFFDFLRAQLEGSVLPVALGEHYDRKTAFDTQYKYIYFNQMNLALKTSLQGKGEDIDPQTMETLKRMHDEFEHSQDAVCEVLVRSFNDRWIVGRCSEKREFYVIFDAAKGASLTEINEEVKKLSAQYFQSIFITE